MDEDGMGKKVISIEEYLKKSGDKKNSKKATSSSQPKKQALKAQNVIHFKDHLSKRKKGFAKPAQSSEKGSLAQTIPFKRVKNPSLPPSEEIFIEEGNVIFASSRFRSQNPSQTGQRPALFLASYGVAGVFLALLTTSIFLFQKGEQMNLALKKEVQSATRRLAQEGVAPPQIIVGRKPTATEQSRGY